MSEYRMEDHQSEEVLRYKEAAAQGDRDALFELGCIYYIGEQAKQDIDYAAECFAKAAEQGHEDAKKGLEWICYSCMRGAKKKNPADQYHAALLCYHGYGVKKDQEQAIRWLREASDAGHPKASREVFFYAEQFARQGDREAMLELADLFEQGVGVTKDAEQAASWREQARKEA